MWEGSFPAVTLGQCRMAVPQFDGSVSKQIQLRLIYRSMARQPQIGLRLKTAEPSYFKSASTSLKLFNPASRFSMISSASWSGSGRLSRSVRLLSFSRKTSRLVLSRARILVGAARVTMK